MSQGKHTAGLCQAGHGGTVIHVVAGCVSTSSAEQSGYVVFAYARAEGSYCVLVVHQHATGSWIVVPY